MAPLTAQAIDGGATALFQATFHVEDLLVKADTLLRDGDDWLLVEVKSGTSVKEEHLADLAFQYHVLRQAGLPLSGAAVMHINYRCRYPRLDKLFTFQNCTAEVRERQPAIAEDNAGMRRIAYLARELDIPIGRHCQDCPFRARCWREVDGLTIYHIPRLSRDKELQLETAGVLYLEEIPAVCGTSCPFSTAITATTPSAPATPSKP